MANEKKDSEETKKEEKVVNKALEIVNEGLDTTPKKPAKITKGSKELNNLFGDLENPVVLVIVDAAHYTNINNKILKNLVNTRKMGGIYITVNKPYDTLVASLKSSGINVKNVFFIDMLTKAAGGTAERTEECLYIESPTGLTEVSIALDEAVKTIKTEKKFLFLDSISTLLIYNQAGTVSQFAHFLSAKMREWGINGIIVSLEAETDKVMLSRLTQFCDKVIKISGDGE